jgi:hypothetical protein
MRVFFVFVAFFSVFAFVPVLPRDEVRRFVLALCAMLIPQEQVNSGACIAIGTAR